MNEKTMMKTAELFPIEAVTMESPRMLWIKKHGIITMSFDESHRFGEWDKWIAGVAPGIAGAGNIAQWFCDETGRNGENHIGCGATEDEAIVDLASKHDLKLWNEETA